jgi:hypothetical protein
MACPTSICNETCPAAVSTINLVTNAISLGTTDVVAVHQLVYPSASSISLPGSDVPVAGTFKLFKNGQLLTPDVDYTLADSIVTLIVAPESTDVYVADYLADRS